MGREIDVMTDQEANAGKEMKLAEQAIQAADVETLADLHRKGLEERRSLLVAIDVILKESKSTEKQREVEVIVSMERVALAAIELAKASLNGKS